MKILIVDDDIPLAEFVRQALRDEGYGVDVARSFAEGHLLTTVCPYDAILLDVTLPDGTGLALLQEIRGRGGEMPVLMLSGRDGTEDVVRGLDAGADDYLTKPFELRVLLARIRALLRRRGARPAPPRTEERVRVGDLELDRLTHGISSGGRQLKLTPREFALLEYFLLNAERVVTREELLERVWGVAFDPGSNVVDAHLARLRAKLRRNEVRASFVTERGAGFRLTASPRSQRQPRS